MHTRIADPLTTITAEQEARNAALLGHTPHLGQRIESKASFRVTGGKVFNLPVAISSPDCCAS